jgi:Kdo2-lipid IVA lauroyltransferase/acyltransferase
MLAYLGYRIADIGVRVLPPAAADRIARSLARLVFWLRPPARTILERNLSRFDPRAPRGVQRRRARQAFEHFALSITDFLRLARLDSAALLRAIDVRGQRHLETARAAGRGVIVLSAHLGNWEWGAAFLAALGPRVHVVARRHGDTRVEDLFARRRHRAGVLTLAERPVWPRAAHALRRGEWVALMADRRAHDTRHSGCAWAVALARRTGALVLPAVIVRVARGRYAACFDAPLSPEAPVAGAYRAAIERVLRRYPDQWLAFEPVPEGLA